MDENDFEPTDSDEENIRAMEKDIDEFLSSIRENVSKTNDQDDVSTSEAPNELDSISSDEEGIENKPISSKPPPARIVRVKPFHPKGHKKNTLNKKKSKWNNKFQKQCHKLRGKEIGESSRDGFRHDSFHSESSANEYDSYQSFPATNDNIQIEVNLSPRSDCDQPRRIHSRERREPREGRNFARNMRNNYSHEREFSPGGRPENVIDFHSEEIDEFPEDDPVYKERNYSYNRSSDEDEESENHRLSRRGSNSPLAWSENYDYDSDFESEDRHQPWRYHNNYNNRNQPQRHEESVFENEDRPQRWRYKKNYNDRDQPWRHEDSDVESEDRRHSSIPRNYNDRNKPWRREESDFVNEDRHHPSRPRNYPGRNKPWRREESDFEYEDGHQPWRSRKNYNDRNQSWRHREPDSYMAEDQDEENVTALVKACLREAIVSNPELATKVTEACMALISKSAEEVVGSGSECDRELGYACEEPGRISPRSWRGSRSPSFTESLGGSSSRSGFTRHSDRFHGHSERRVSENSLSPDARHSGRNRFDYQERHKRARYSPDYKRRHDDGRPSTSASPAHRPRKRSSSEHSKNHHEEEFNLKGAVSWSMKKIRKRCEQESSIVRRALLSLLEVHKRECKMYMKKPEAHPDHAREYREFVNQKTRSILDLGGDPNGYNFEQDWKKHWPVKMYKLFQESWNMKMQKCTSLLEKKSNSASKSSHSSSRKSSTKHHHEKRKRKHHQGSEEKNNEERAKKVKSYKMRQELEAMYSGLDEQYSNETNSTTLLNKHVEMNNEILSILKLLNHIKHRFNDSEASFDKLYAKAMNLNKESVAISDVLLGHLPLLEEIDANLKETLKDENLSLIQKVVIQETHERFRTFLKKSKETHSHSQRSEDVTVMKQSLEKDATIEGTGNKQHIPCHFSHPVYPPVVSSTCSQYISVPPYTCSPAPTQQPTQLRRTLTEISLVAAPSHRTMVHNTPEGASDAPFLGCHGQAGMVPNMNLSYDASGPEKHPTQPVRTFTQIPLVESLPSNVTHKHNEMHGGTNVDVTQPPPPGVTPPPPGTTTPPPCVSPPLPSSVTTEPTVPPSTVLPPPTSVTVPPQPDSVTVPSTPTTLTVPPSTVPPPSTTRTVAPSTESPSPSGITVAPSTESPSPSGITVAPSTDVTVPQPTDVTVPPSTAPPPPTDAAVPPSNATSAPDLTVSPSTAPPQPTCVTVSSSSATSAPGVTSTTPGMAAAPLIVTTAPGVTAAPSSDQSSDVAPPPSNVGSPHDAKPCPVTALQQTDDTILCGVAQPSPASISSPSITPPPIRASAQPHSIITTSHSATAVPRSATVSSDGTAPTQCAIPQPPSNATSTPSTTVSPSVANVKSNVSPSEGNSSASSALTLSQSPAVASSSLTALDPTSQVAVGKTNEASEHLPTRLASLDPTHKPLKSTASKQYTRQKPSKELMRSTIKDCFMSSQFPREGGVRVSTKKGLLPTDTSTETSSVAAVPNLTEDFLKMFEVKPEDEITSDAKGNAKMNSTSSTNLDSPTKKRIKITIPQSSRQKKMPEFNHTSDDQELL